MPGYLNPEFAENGGNRQALCQLDSGVISRILHFGTIDGA
jgi:hypothetical protein